MNVRQSILIFSALFLIVNSKGESLQDSLKTVLKQDIHDTTFINVCGHISRTYYMADIDSGLKYGNIAKQLSDSLNYYKGSSGSRRFIGWHYIYSGEFDKSMTQFQEELKLAEEKQDSSTIVGCFMNIGVVFYYQNNPKSVVYWKKAVKYFLAKKRYAEASDAINNISMVYKEQEKFDSAKYYLNVAITYAEELNDNLRLGKAKVNLGNFHKSLAEADYSRDNFELALKYYLEAYALLEPYDKPDLLVICDVNIAAAYQSLDQHDKAYPLLINALNYYRNSVEIDGLKVVHKGLSTAYRHMGEYELAISHLDSFIIYEEQMKDETMSKITAEMEAKYETEKKSKENEKLKLENDLKEAKITQSKNFEIALIIGVIILIAIVFLIFRQFQIKKKANLKLEGQQKIISEKNAELEDTNFKLEKHQNEILDSIKYAKRIQEAILPSVEEMSTNLKNGFVLYQPKDVVAGDFYWQESVNNIVYVAAADCTGHGVPGAMVSVVCSNALTKAVMEDGITDVGKILDRTREIVIKKLAKSGDVKDGMDISLACFDFENMKLEWAGANNPLYLLRDNEIQITKGDKEPIGFTENPTSFTKHTFDLQKGDTIYLFTDGYADQFGGAEGKKLGYKKFREKLLEISTQDTGKGNEILSTYLKKWQGSEEQVDDVCVIGVKV